MPDTFGGVHPGAAIALKTATRPGIGTFITDSGGRPLYVTDADQGGTSSCHDNCALTWWPAFAPTAHMTAQAPLHSEMISTFERSDFPASHPPQVRYNGMPLYYYLMDTDHGDPHGQGLFVFSGHWYLVSPEGVAIGKKPPVNILGTGGR
jgi:predicted lipoprotein with Yx(FWY)xxD motif